MLDSDIKGMTNSGNGQQVGIGNINNIDASTININNNHVEYAAKYERYKELRNKKLYCPYLWSYDKDQPELEALREYLRKNAD